MPTPSPRTAAQPHPERNVARIIRELAADQVGGRRLTDTDRITALRRLAEAGALQSLEPLLPLALRLNGKPYHLTDHYPFGPVFDTVMPRRILLKTGRQVSKSTSLAAHGVVLANCVPNFKTLYVMPRYEQVRRFSNNYVRPFIDQSPIKALWTGTSVENSVLQRSFKNLSTMIFSFALLDADRIRGVSADRLGIDEVQDMDPAHLDIIGETMSHSSWSITQYTGTPKSIDNPIEGLWQRSSMAEWFVPCYSCRTWNIPSLDHHLDAMIGPLRDDISAARPGLVCHRCRKPISPRPPHGRWVHRRPSLKFTFAGYHVPQIILPLHCERYDKWAELLAKQSKTAPRVFYNEVLGESVDAGQKLVTETDLRQSCTLPFVNNPARPSAAVMRALPHYRMRVLAIDWGGGGIDGVSFTALALLGLSPNGQVHTLWGRRLLTPNDHLAEAVQVIDYVRQTGVELVAHDYTGAGIGRETTLVQAGFPVDRVMAVQLIGAATGDLIRYVPPTPLHQRAHYRLDKTRSLIYVFNAIKVGLLRFFQWDTVDREQPGLISDFLALIENKVESRRGGDIYSIVRNPMFTDDFAQAVNIGAAALWHANACWPNFAQAASIARLSETARRSAGDRDYGWENEPTTMGPG